jgi:hypothetical protein
MSNDRNTSDRARVEVRPGVFLWLSGPDLVNFRARQAPPDAPAITSAAVAAPENAALAVPKPRSSPAPVKPQRPSARKD